MEGILPSCAEFYSHADRILAEGTKTSLRLSFFCQTRPSLLSPEETQRYLVRLKALQTFFEISLEIFRKAIYGELSPAISRFLLNDTPASLRTAFHRYVPESQYFPPRSFRTDETTDHKIMEIQCPGSGWGDLQMLRDLYSTYIDNDRLSKYAPSTIVADAICSIVGKEPGAESTTVLHLLDNASAPASIKYLIHGTFPTLKHWGFHDAVKYSKCDFVRSHSFFGLVADNLFRIRLEDADSGKIYFDQPPIVLFDQKAALALPFWKLTRDFYPQEVRDCFVYTYPVLPQAFPDENGPLGFYDENDLWIDLDLFIKRPAKQRPYFLKYAGSDVTVNWGSRSVYCLSEPGSNTYLRQLAQQYRKRRYNVIQSDASSIESVQYFDRDSCLVTEKDCYSKRSGFFCADSFVGIKTMHRQVRLVHGQPDTIAGLLVP